MPKATSRIIIITMRARKIKKTSVESPKIFPAEVEAVGVGVGEAPPMGVNTG